MNTAFVRIQLSGVWFIALIHYIINIYALFLSINQRSVAIFDTLASRVRERNPILRGDGTKLRAWILVRFHLGLNALGTIEIIFGLMNLGLKSYEGTFVGSAQSDGTRVSSFHTW